MHILKLWCSLCVLTGLENCKVSRPTLYTKLQSILLAEKHRHCLFIRTNRSILDWVSFVFVLISIIQTWSVFDCIALNCLHIIEAWTWNYLRKYFEAGMCFRGYLGLYKTAYVARISRGDFVIPVYDIAPPAGRPVEVNELGGKALYLACMGVWTAVTVVYCRWTDQDIAYHGTHV